MSEPNIVERNADWVLQSLSDGLSVRRKAWAPGAYLSMHGNFAHLRRRAPGGPVGLVQELIIFTRYACIWGVAEDRQGEPWQPDLIADDLGNDDWEIVA